MFLALIKEFNPQHITQNCSAADIDADVIIFFDPHSNHHIYIDGIEKHSSLKYEYVNDPHQPDLRGKYLNGPLFHKLGPQERCERTKKRNINFIISPYREGYYQSLAPYLDNPEQKLAWFPPAPAKPITQIYNLSVRLKKVLANGHINTFKGLNHYSFRKWAFKQPEVTYIKGCIQNPISPKGKDFIPFLTMFAGALALCDIYTVPKYFEIPLAGCVCFAQKLPEYEDLGFKDFENCIFVNKKNFHKRINSFLNNVKDYQSIADAGRKLVEENYTAEHFARFIKNHIGDSL